MNKARNDSDDRKRIEQIRKAVEYATNEQELRFLLAHIDKLEAALREAVELLKEVAQMRVSYYTGPLKDDHKTTPIKVETRETIQSVKARAFLEKWEGK